MRIAYGVDGTGFAPIRTNPILVNGVDGGRLRFSALKRGVFTDQEAQEYGVYWVDVPEIEGQKWGGDVRLVDGVLVPVMVTPDPIPEDVLVVQAYQEKKDEIAEEFDQIMGMLGAKYSPAERETWYRQLEEAREHKGNGNAHTPLLEAYSRGKSNEKSALADRILTLADQLATLTGQALADKQDRVTALEAIDLEAADARDQIEAV